METRLFGLAKVSLPLVSLGGAPLADLYTEIPEDQAIATVHAALAAGITCIDTAPRYGNGLSERRIGQALQAIPRDRYVLATKVGYLITPEGDAAPAMSGDGVQRSLSDSLERLGLDRIDIVHIHDPEGYEREVFDDVFPMLADLRAQGVIRAVSAGMNQWEMLDRFLTRADFDGFMLAGRYTLLEHHASRQFLDRCAARGIGIMLAGVFNSGILATGARPGAKFNYQDAPEAVIERVRQLELICTQHGTTLAAAAMQFPLAHPAITTIVLGMSAPEEVAANLAALAAPVSSACWQALRAAGLIDPAAPMPITD